MDEQAYKEVYYDQYCKTCKNRSTAETEEPCNECLSEPINLNTHRPVNYERKEPK